MVEGIEVLKNLRAKSAVSLITAEEACAILAKSRQHRIPRSCQGPEVVGQLHLPCLARRARKRSDDAIREAALSLQGASDEAQVEIIGEELLRFESATPSIIDARTERLRKFSDQLRLDTPPHDMMVEREARRTDGLKHHIAQAFAIVQLGGIGSLEHETTDREDLHKPPVAKHDRMVVDLREIRELLPSSSLAWPIFKAPA
jgi:hypothetical protein